MFFERHNALEDSPSGSNDEPSMVKVDISSKSDVDKLEVNVGVNYVAEGPQGREVQMGISHEEGCERHGGSLQGKVGSKGWSQVKVMILAKHLHRWPNLTL